MRVLNYHPISPKRYITLEDLKDEGLGVCVCYWIFHDMNYQRLLQGGSPKTKNRGYSVLGKAYAYHRKYLQRCSLPTKYKITDLPKLGLLQITGVAYHPTPIPYSTEIGTNLLFFTLADGKCGFCEISKSWRAELSPSD